MSTGMSSPGQSSNKNNNFISFEWDEKPNGMHYSYNAINAACVCAIIFTSGHASKIIQTIKL